MEESKKKKIWIYIQFLRSIGFNIQISLFHCKQYFQLFVVLKISDMVSCIAVPCSLPPPLFSPNFPPNSNSMTSALPIFSLTQEKHPK